MSHRPAAVIAHLGGLHFFTDHDLEVLGRVANIADPDPVGDWDDPRAAALLADAEIIVGHWGCPLLDRGLLDLAPRLGLFAYAAGTVKDVVTPAVFERGVRVTTGARANAEPVAEFTLAATLFAGKDVFRRRDALRDPGVADPGVGPSTVPLGNWAKTVGIVGASMVGRRVIELLRPFPHLAVALYDPFVDEQEAAALGVELLTLDELCATADVVSIHAPDLPSTRHMIGRSQLAAMKSGATLINTARGALVDHEALTAELSSGRISAVLDVTDPEPLPSSHPLLHLPNVFVTPHLAGSEGTELARMAEHVAEEIRRWSAGEPGYNEIRADQLDRLA